MFSFYSLYIRWKIFLSERIFYFRKPFAKATCSFSFYCASSLFSFYFSHSLLKNTDLYLNFCMLVSVCMFSEDSRRSENFPFPFFVSTSTHGSWLCCSAVWKISSQILTEIKKVDIEDATMLNGKKCIFFLSCARDVCFVLFFVFFLEEERMFCFVFCFFLEEERTWWRGSSNSSKPELFLFAKLGDS